MSDFFQRISWQAVAAFGWFCACVVYALVHVPEETWQHVAAINVYALCAGIAALLSAVAAFFRGPVVKPKSEPPPVLTVAPPAMSAPPPPPLPSEYTQPRTSLPPGGES